MSKQIIILLATLAITALAITEEEFTELKSAGMSESGLNGLRNLDNRYKIEFPKVSGNEEEALKYTEKFVAEMLNYVKTMTPQDQDIYNNYVKKFEDD